MRDGWKYGMLPMGALFGFILSRAGATTYDFYAGLFLFQDLQLMWVIGVAASVGALGVLALQALGVGVSAVGEPIQYRGKPWRRSLVPGALLFGAGWGLAGVCPGTGLVMLGEGKLMAGVAIAGIFFGTWLYGVIEGAGTRSARLDSHEREGAVEAA